VDDGILEVAGMATTEERVSYLEAKMEDVGKALVEVKAAIAALDQKVDRRFDAVDLKFMEVNRRVDGVKNLVFMVLLAVVAGLFGVVAKLL
jgi:chromosome segregation ATPase